MLTILISPILHFSVPAEKLLYKHMTGKLKEELGEEFRLLAYYEICIGAECVVAEGKDHLV